MIDIINAHKLNFPKRTLLTGKLIGRNTPLDKDVGLKKIISYDRSTTLRRILTWGIGFLQIVWIVKTRFRSSHLYIASNPPFATLLPLLCKNNYSLLVLDVYPDALVEYKILKPGSSLIRLWHKANRRIFNKAHDIFVLSNGMKTLLSQYVSADKVTVSPLWSDNNFIKPVPKAENQFIKQHNLQTKFVVMYSGNLGYTHNLEVLIDAAALVTNQDILFLVIGEGKKRKKLEQHITSHKLKNCILLPWQDVSMLPYSMAAADLAVVTLGKEASLLSVPSKIYNFMSAGVPLLCIADERSELFGIVEQYQCGACFSGEDPIALKEYIELLALNKDRLTELNEKSLRASKKFDPENAFNLVAK